TVDTASGYEGRPDDQDSQEAPAATVVCALGYVVRRGGDARGRRVRVRDGSPRSCVRAASALRLTGHPNGGGFRRGQAARAHPWRPTITHAIGTPKFGKLLASASPHGRALPHVLRPRFHLSWDGNCGRARRIFARRRAQRWDGRD